ncbi:MAG TPA: sigma-70 family RNA polymerase sigma factor [Planctomycetota bacterium]|nr:sigma-70 family RNA polymerase sigma factor [Planctomycetota bacterium]
MAGKYNYECIELFRNELMFAPTRIRKRYIFRLERFVTSLNLERTYPYDYIYHKITNIRPEEDVVVSAGGRELQSDLLKLLADLSESLDIQVKDTGEPVFTVPEMMARYGVSGKTVYRWRKRGLVGYEFLFPDGKKRIGFRLSNVQEFEERSTDLISKSASFSLVEDSEKTRIISLAQEAIAEGVTIFSDVVVRVSEASGRSRETIRYMLKKHDQDNPDHRLFPELRTPLTNDDKEAIFRLYTIGIPMRVLCKEYRRNRSTIYRIIYQIKASEILVNEVSYVYTAEFDSPDAPHTIVECPAEVTTKPPEPTLLDASLVDELPTYLRDLHRKAKLLTREEERTLFRRFNYLKHVMISRREQLKVAGARAEIINEIEDLYHRAVNIKQHIIRSNLRLVVSIAKRHTRSAMDFNTLISDGNLSLLQAAEKFDYARGNRFSTYASWAIMKNYAKSIPEESNILDTFRTAAPETLELIPGLSALDETSKPELMAGFKKLLNRVLRRLTEREREVVIARFGLRTDGSRATLEEIGSSFDLSKERIRQIEAKALAKLRSELDLDQVDTFLE